MASSPISSWQIGGETMETVRDFIFLAPKSLQMVTEAMKLKILAPWKKRYDQARQHIKNQRHYFATKVCLVKAMFFLVVIYRCESWTIKKTECQKTYAFELRC